MKQKKIVLMILGVLKHDPLYTWSISPLKMRAMRSEEFVAADNMEVDDAPAPASRNSINDNKDAHRALLGIEDRLSRTISIESQINELIQTARNDENLALMYQGWQPWL